MIRFARPLYLTVLPLLLAAAAALPLTSLAHSDGATFTATVGDYLVDVDYSEATIEVGKAGRFEFGILSGPAYDRPVDFTHVWVRLERAGEETVFSANIHRAAIGGAGFALSFSSVGEYLMHVRYYKGEEEIVAAEIPITVEVGGETVSVGQDFWLGALGGFVGGILALAAVHTYRRRSAA